MSERESTRTEAEKAKRKRKKNMKMRRESEREMRNGTDRGVKKRHTGGGGEWEVKQGMVNGKRGEDGVTRNDQKERVKREGTERNKRNVK